MAYGTPSSIDDVEAYYTDILGGRSPSPEQLTDLSRRYKSIGGRSPLLEITTAQATGIGERAGIVAYVGQKHAPPFVADAVGKMKADHIERAVGLVLAPHYSFMSIGDYERRARAAADDVGWDGEFTMIESWHDEEGYIGLLAERVHTALGKLSAEARAGATVVFTAHSLPTRILEMDDPYPSQLDETAQLVAGRAGLERWQVAWQSAGETSDKWLGPDICEVLVELAAKDVPGVVVCPCGFVADHLEVLYDIDIEAKALAVDLEIELVRTASPNDDPAFLDTLAGLVRRTLDN